MSYQCSLCPNNCLIRNGKFGICGVRGAADNQLSLPCYGRLSACSSDPIEKKPLYHFYPGSSIFSVGFFGCSLSCPFCQNYRISKEFQKPQSDIISPEQIIRSAADSGARAIAYTYSEPVVHFEWVTETASRARKAGLKNVLVTNGYINPEPGSELLKDIDAVNIDLKSFEPDFYRKELKAKLEPVKKFIQNAASRVHTEVTTLVIPGKNDSETEISSAAAFIAGINENIPYHLSAYYPAYKYSTAPTKPSALVKLSDIAARKLNFVFTGNISIGPSDTLCPRCGNMLISRNGYSTSIPGIAGGLCTKCGTPASAFGIII